MWTLAFRDQYRPLEKVLHQWCQRRDAIGRFPAAVAQGDTKQVGRIGSDKLLAAAEGGKYPKVSLDQVNVVPWSGHRAPRCGSVFDIGQKVTAMDAGRQTAVGGERPLDKPVGVSGIGAKQGHPICHDGRPSSQATKDRRPLQALRPPVLVPQDLL